MPTGDFLEECEMQISELLIVFNNDDNDNNSEL